MELGIISLTANLLWGNQSLPHIFLPTIIINLLIYCMKINSFLELKELINTGNIHKLQREEFRLDVDQYIYDKYCELIDRDIALELLKEEIEYNRKHPKLSITKNRFGYTKLLQNLSNIKHLNLWYTDDTTEIEILDYLSSIYPNNEFIIHESLQSHKSVPEIEHKHIFLELDSLVRQYTGLKDKNGVKIYEGDILKLEKKSNEILSYVPISHSNDYGVVEWTHSKFYLNFGFLHNELGSQARLDLYKATVISNIVSNPELLKTKTV